MSNAFDSRALDGAAGFDPDAESQFDYELRMAGAEGEPPPRLRPEFEPAVFARALARRVLAVATTRVEGTWSAYVDAVPGNDHCAKRAAVLDVGARLPEELARLLFPELQELPYAE